jgi:hypothetical protein
MADRQTQINEADGRRVVQKITKRASIKEDHAEAGGKRWDPYFSLGIGYNVYFRTMKVLAITFGFFALPSFVGYCYYLYLFYTNNFK